MSIEALHWSFGQLIKPSSVKFVLVALCDFANEELEAYPAVDTLAKKTSLDRKTVLKAIGKLVESGFLIDTEMFRGRTGRVKVYKIVIQPSVTDDPNGSKYGSVKQYQKRNGSNNGIVPKVDGNSTNSSDVTVPLSPCNSTNSGTQNPHRTPIGTPNEGEAPASAFVTELFCMFAEWEPSIPPEVWGLLESQGVTDEIHDQELERFKIHHITEAGERTGHQWTKSFIHSLKGRIARLSDETNQRGSEQDPIGDRSWAESEYPFPETAGS